MKKIEFSDVKNDILAAIEHSKKDITEKLILIDGFVSEPINKELTDSLTIGGPRVPMIMCIGEETGRVYLFALKALLPDRF